MNLRRTLEARLREALVRCGAPEGSPAVVAPSPRPEFGDYQASGAMAAAKRLKTNPRALAQKVAEHLAPGGAADLSDLADRVEIAGPGFINIFLKGEFLRSQLSAASADERLGAEPAATPQTVVVDYSAPNIAKEMQVQHLRSTIIGDALSRVLVFTGHRVVRQNHVGDWGTQFGSVILSMWHICMARNRGDQEYIRRTLAAIVVVPSDSPRRVDAVRPILDQHQKDLSRDWDGKKIFKPFLQDIRHCLSWDDLLDAYRLVNRIELLADGADLIIERAPDHKPIPYSSLSSHVTKMLQDLENPDNEQERTAWEFSREITLAACGHLYERMGVLLTNADVRGESAYNDDLPKVIEELTAKGLLTSSQGARCVFLPEFKGKDDEPLPFIVQKSDGGYLYATTDLAAVWFRCGHGQAEGDVDWAADRILYVVGASQSLHFKMLFAVARKAGFAPEGVSLEHVPFGMVMGSDGKPFKTRASGTVKLMDLLEEGVKKALDLVTRKNAEDVEKGRSEPLSEEQKGEIAEAVGIGAVKYADLSQNRTSDYVFSFEKMLSLDGNTAPYMQYAYARIRSIFRKGAASDNGDLSASPGLRVSGSFSLLHPAERALAVKLLQFPETVEAVAEQCLPNVLCSYLYELAGLFMGFYENCPVLQSEPSLRASRLALCDLTARVIRKGLELLGIGTVERM